jgi:hypothetical protein
MAFEIVASEDQALVSLRQDRQGHAVVPEGVALGFVEA